MGDAFGVAGPARPPNALRPRPSREGAPAPPSEVRVKPGAPPIGRPRASTRPRWPVDAKVKQEIGMVFLHPPRCWRGRVGRGLDRREPGRSGWKPPVRQPRPLSAANMASARSRSKLQNPRNPSRPGEDSGARERRAKPLPTLPLAEAVVSAKRKRKRKRRRRRRGKKSPHADTESSTISLRLRRRLNSLQPCALRRPFAHHCDSGSATRNTHPALPDRPRAHVYRCEASASC